MDEIYDIIIIGAGPAGMTAGIYGSRAGLKVLLIEGSAPGGKLVKTFKIDNWPGEKSISGVDLAVNMFDQVSNLGVTSEFVNVAKVVDLGKNKKVVTEDGREFTSKVVIVATGTVETKMHIPHEEENIGRGVSFCAVCDGAFYKNKDVIVVGGGNSALEEAIYLTQFAKQVTIMIRRDVFRGDVSTQHMVIANPKIKILKKHIPIEVLTKDNKVNGLRVKDVDTGELSDLSCDGIFPYIGAKPSTGFLDGLGITDEAGYIIANEKMETSIKGIYGAGDTNAKQLRQIVTAVSDGAIAAQNAFHYIKES